MNIRYFLKKLFARKKTMILHYQVGTPGYDIVDAFFKEIYQDVKPLGIIWCIEYLGIENHVDMQVRVTVSK